MTTPREHGDDPVVSVGHAGGVGSSPPLPVVVAPATEASLMTEAADAAVRVTPPPTPPMMNHDPNNNDQNAPAAAATSNPENQDPHNNGQDSTPAPATTTNGSSANLEEETETVPVRSILKETTTPPQATTTATTPTVSSSSTSPAAAAAPASSSTIQHYSRVDLSFGKWIADGGFCRIFELVSIQDLDSGDYVVKGSSPTITAGVDTSSVNTPPTKKRDHKRGASAFGNFAAGLVTGGGGGAGNNHKRLQSSPAGLAAPLPPFLKTASLTVVSNLVGGGDNVSRPSTTQSMTQQLSKARSTGSRRSTFMKGISSRQAQPTPQDDSSPNNIVLKCFKPKTIQDPNLLSLGLKDMEIEIEVLQKLNGKNPHIVQLKAFGTMELEEQQLQSSASQLFDTPSSDAKSANSPTDNNIYPFVILERLGETLEEKLSKWQAIHLKHSTLVGKMITHRKHSKSTFYLEERLQVLCDLASALAFLHGQKIIYRDLKPDNINFDRTKGQLKLIDFGLAKDLSHSQSENQSGLYRLTGLTGSARYMAPEVARQDLYNESCDVYSFAIVMWEVMALETPYAKFNVDKMFQRVYDCPHVRPPLDEWEEGESEQKFGWLVLLLSHMWSPLIENRPSMAHIHAKLRGQLKQVQIQQQQDHQQQQEEAARQK